MVEVDVKDANGDAKTVVIRDRDENGVTTTRIDYE